MFAKLYESDPNGRISINSFLSYVTKKFWLHQTRIGLSLYDGAGLGYLKESDLENYIFELIPTLPQLESLEKSFYSFYVCTAVRKFFFFLDPLRTGRVKITEILSSGFLDQLIELRDEELSKDHLETNWFSAQCAQRVYGQYLNLDEDHNGMLSKQELARSNFVLYLFNVDFCSEKIILSVLTFILPRLDTNVSQFPSGGIFESHKLECPGFPIMFNYKNTPHSNGNGLIG